MLLFANESGPGIATRYADVLIVSARSVQWQTLHMTHPIRLRRNPVI
jgi:hypothetical protein